MKIQLSFDETLSTGYAKTGSTVTITGANADECFALALMRRGVLIDENAVAAATGDVGPSYASYVARQADDSGISISNAAPAVGMASGTLFARVSGAGTVTLVDDGGGRVTLNGRSLLATSTPFVAGTPVKITLALNGKQRVVTLYPAKLATISAVVDQGPWLGQRGTNIAMPFMYGITADANNLYGNAVFSPTWASTGPAKVANIVADGHDWVRLNFLPDPFLEAIKNGNSARLDQLFGLIKPAVDDCLAAGLKVLLCSHVNGDNPLWTPDIILASTSAAEYGYYKTLLRQIATRFLSYPTNKLSIEVFNEPTDTYTAAHWQPQAADLWQTVRAIMPYHTLLITGGLFGNADGLMAFNASGFDARTTYSVHFYEPQPFTFQGISFSTMKYITTALPWPVPSTSLAAALTSTQGNVNADSTLTTAQKTTLNSQFAYYINENYGWYSRVKIIARFAAMARWAAQYGVAASQIVVGEFGCNQNIAIASQAAWFQDVRQAAEAYGMAWATFLYDAANFQVADSATGRLKSGLTTALFGTLTKSAEAQAVLAAMAVQPPAADAIAIDRTIQHLKDGGVWATGGSFKMPVAHTLQAALVDWILPSRAGTTTGTLTFSANKYVAGGTNAFHATGYILGGAGAKYTAGSATLAMLKLGGPDSDGDIATLNYNDALARNSGYGAMAINTYTVEFPGLGIQPNLGNAGFLAGVSRSATTYEKFDYQYNSIGTTTMTGAGDQGELMLWKNGAGSVWSSAQLGATWAGGALTADQIRVLGMSMTGFAYFKNALPAGWAII